MQIRSQISDNGKLCTERADPRPRVEERKTAERTDRAVSGARSGKLLTEEDAEREISTITRGEKTQLNSQRLSETGEGSLSSYSERSERLSCNVQASD